MSEPIVSDKKFCERLRRQADDGHHWDRAPAMLRESAERIERLTRGRDEWKEWHANMQALRDKHSASVDRLMAERDRLRAALERVARWNEHFEYAFSQDIMEFAREALQEPKP